MTLPASTRKLSIGIGIFMILLLVARPLIWRTFNLWPMVLIFGWIGAVPSYIGCLRWRLPFRDFQARVSVYLIIFLLTAGSMVLGAIVVNFLIATIGPVEYIPIIEKRINPSSRGGNVWEVIVEEDGRRETVFVNDTQWESLSPGDFVVTPLWHGLFGFRVIPKQVEISHTRP